MSVAVTVVTATVFSAMTSAAVARPLSDVMTGRSLTGVTLMVALAGVASVSPPPSTAVNWKLVVPLQFALGTK